MGFASIYTREDVGGAGLSRLDAAIIFEALAYGCPSTAAILTVHNMCSWMIDTFASEDLRQKYLPDLVGMDKLAAYCLTEPDAGSDAASLQTSAVRDGDEYVINGAKAFISGAGSASVYVVMARTGGPGAKGISTILVDKDTPGLNFGEKERKHGWRCQPTRMVFFDNVRVPVSQLVGEEGKGFTYAMKGLDGGRINIASMSLGGAQACLNMAAEHVATRKQFGKPLHDQQSVQFKLADMATELTAARLMVHRAAELLDQRSPAATMHCAMAKRYATDVGYKVVNDALQLHGGYGYLKDYPIEKYLRDLRIHTILEGTNEIMRVITARHIVKPQ
jgi:alkylation response protein AidB-like acyl-CoA dehydrogenase